MAGRPLAMSVVFLLCVYSRRAVLWCACLLPAAACRCREQAGTPQNRTARVHTEEEHDRHGEWPAGHALLATQVNNSIINILRAIRLLISFLCF